VAFSDLTSDTQAALKRLAAFSERQLGRRISFVSTLRSCAQQNSLYAQGRTTGGRIVTNAEGCESWHVLGRAADINLGPGATRDDYNTLGLFWEDLGGRWSGRFEGLDDPGHFEWHPGVRIHDICPDPSNCSAGIARSRDISLSPPPGLGGPPWLVPVLVASSVFGGYLLWDRYLRR